MLLQILSVTYVVSIMDSVMIIMLLCVQRLNLRALHLRLVSLDKIKSLQRKVSYFVIVYINVCCKDAIVILTFEVLSDGIMF